MCHAQIISSRVVESRKERRCGWCQMPVHRGELYLRLVSKDESTLDTTTDCLFCASLLRVWSERCERGEECQTQEGVREDIRELGREHGGPVVMGWVLDAKREILRKAGR